MSLHECKHHLNKIETSPRGGITPINGKIFWHIDEEHISQDLDKYKIIHAVQKAFNVWQGYMNPIFEACEDKSKCQIVFKFMLPDNPEVPFPYDGALAYAFFPEGESLDITSDVYVNEIYNWGVVHTASGYNLLKVLIHEVGHSIGLNHSEILQDIMYPSYQPNDIVTIDKDTIDGIYKLYGVKAPEVDHRECIINFIKNTFENKASLSRLYEKEIVQIANAIGIDSKLSDRKSETVDKIIKLISNY